MKFLILFSCVCAASAAYINAKATVKPWQLSGQASFGSSQLQPTTKGVVIQTYQPVTKPTTEPLIKGSYTQDAAAPILRSENTVDIDGFKYSYETGNGISAEATGHLKKVNNVDVITMEGQFQYPGGPNGEKTLLTYTADENGYQPKSDLLPTPPPMPIEIVRLLEYLTQHATAEPTKKF